MKKTLFSLAFLAASGGYVAFANHGFDSILQSTTKTDETAVLPLPRPEPTASINPATPPAASILPSVAPGLIIEDVAIAAAPVLSQPLTAPPLPTVSLPPLPRPRPVNAPTLETAQAATTTVPISTSLYRAGTYKGTSENAYYGRVQVQVTVAASQIVSVEVLDYPSDRRTSRYINSQALPMLQQEVMQTQSANVDTISGATLTSEAYARSLGSALRKATGANA